MEKVVILAGGIGSRLAEQTEVRPKPMVEIGGRPILWHIMKSYAHYGFKEFVIALGYKGELVKRYFLDYCTLAGNMTVRLSDGHVEVKKRESDDWTIHLVDTGLHVLTGGRIKRLERMLREERFLLTYGDGVADVDLRAVLEFHKRTGKRGTVTAVRPPARFGGLSLEGDLVRVFEEKPQVGEGWINGGFMCLEPSVFDYLEGDNDILERDVLERMATDSELAAYRHDRFWQCMDTMRDLKTLEGLWESGKPPWKCWR
jgi:glucose-1-phosphate cytidylyltransferase